MIKLKNIQISKNKAECEIFPEDSKEKGYIIINTNTGKVMDYSLPVGYEWCENHINHARLALLKISKAESIPNDKLLMWY